MKLLGKTELTSGPASYVELTNIDTSYRDLMIVFTNQRNTASVDGAISTINGTSSSFVIRYFDGDGGSARTGLINNSSFTGYAQSSAAGYFTSTYFVIQNYNSSANKSITILSSAPGETVGAYLGFQNLMAPVTGVTSIRLSPNGSSDWLQYSSFYVYGLK